MALFSGLLVNPAFYMLFARSLLQPSGAQATSRA